MLTKHSLKFKVQDIGFNKVSPFVDFTVYWY